MLFLLYIHIFIATCLMQLYVAKIRKSFQTINVFTQIYTLFNKTCYFSTGLVELCLNQKYSLTAKSNWSMNVPTPLRHSLIYIGSDVIHHLLLHIGWTIERVIDLGAMDAYRVDDHLGVGAYLFRLTSRPWIVF